MLIHNPVLPGFNPDPVIFRDGERYRIIVSTFEWLPGLRVYSSDDLAHWSYETAVLDGPAAPELRGNPAACSIWGPFAVWRNGTYYVAYTNVRSTRVPYKDCDNYVVTATSLNGPWSEPVYVNSSGFDPSLFFDDDGRAYFLNAIWDYRMDTRNKSAGVVMQEIDPRTLELIGEARVIFPGTAARKTEAPQIYKHDGWYYLLTAEGGTESGHQETVARSRSVWGPYEADPETPLITAADDPTLPLQCAGHASLVETPGGDWYLAYLCSRPFENNDGFSILGRETAIQRVRWTDDGWLRLADGGHHPQEVVEVPDAGVRTDCADCVDRADSGGTSPIVPSPSLNVGNPVVGLSDPGFDDPLTGPSLNPNHWNTLRQLPDGEWLEFAGAGLTIRGGQSPQSFFDQHIVGTRQTALACTASVTMDYVPDRSAVGYLKLAGLTLYLNDANYVLFMVTAGDDGPVAVLQQSVRGEFSQVEVMPVSDGGGYDLSVRLNGNSAWFTVGDGTGETRFAPLDVTFLSGGYTGNFIGLDVIDMDRRNASAATFRDFRYRVLG
ncbi:family 43 glycosylhydrolase [Bifidobacterium avesanii]|uniref:Family 43 glycosylhydrolase n=1 Tax=Bifidobacterium avesanii TaxID=1798157 RepID=A0A7K3TJ96_9BIFI|nr:family 43 glycosylhydrolase [Bifidobacterium avesanii]KAB8291924.1 glycosyl hydrolase, family 43 [Bifidobacterium avesanii]NEG79026.1 family 43 glycosylhydrolase [Bifidobacterium avesanii]